MSSAELPVGWAQASLGSLCQIVGGGTPSTAKPSFWDGDVPWITSADIAGIRQIIPRKAISQEAIANSTTSLVPAGAIIVVTRVGLGKVALAPFPLCFSQDSQGLIFNHDLANPLYLTYFLSEAVKRFKYQGRGTTISGVTKKQLSDLSTQLPPTAEQRRIVSEIEQQFTRLDAAVAALQRAKLNLKRYRAGVLTVACRGHLAPTEAAPFDASQCSDESGSDLLQRLGVVPAAHSSFACPEGWAFTTIGQLARVGTGATPLRTRREYYEGGTIPWVTSGALNASFVDTPTELITELALKQTNAKIFPRGTLLVAMYGEGKTRGKVSELRLEAATNQACAALTFPSETSELKPMVKLFLESNYEATRRLASGGVQPNLNLSLIRGALVPVPPLAEQHRIVAEVDRRLSIIRDLEATIDANLKRADRLRQSILKRAFEGKLVPQDPNDEPASVLLERIRAERAAAHSSKTNIRRLPKRSGAHLLDDSLERTAEA